MSGAPHLNFDPSVLLLFPVFLVSIVVHECAHALVAWWHGDPTARERGRLTLNPLPHVHPIGSILVPGMLLAFRAPLLFGWAKPVPVDWARLRRPRDDQLKVALAGPASNFLLALMFAGVIRLAPEAGFWAPLKIMGVAGVYWNCALGLFNLIPIPPLDGSWLLMRYLPLRHIIVLQQFRLVGMGIVVLLLSLPMFSDALVHRPLRMAVTACLDLFGISTRGIVL